MRYVVVGLPCLDFIDGREASVGGSVVFCALAATRLGVPVRAYMRGTPQLHEMVAQVLPNAEIHWEDAEHDTEFVIEHHASGRTVDLRSHAGELEGVPHTQAGDVLHLAPVMHELSPRHLGSGVAGVHALTPQGLLRPRPSTLPPIKPGEDPEAQLWSDLDVLVASPEDGAGLDELLTRVGPETLVVMTDGPRGGRAQRGEQFWTYNAVGEAYPHSPVGAGDVFAAGLFVALGGGAAVDAALHEAAGLVDTVVGSASS
jgi:hypothetical protein